MRSSVSDYAVARAIATVASAISDRVTHGHADRLNAHVDDLRNTLLRVDDLEPILQPAANSDPEALLALFFPSDDDDRGFYSTFEPHCQAQAIRIDSTEGRDLIARLGLLIRPKADGALEVGWLEHGQNWIRIHPTLLRLDDNIFAGYWDGDGYVAISGDNGQTWHTNADIKDASYWTTTS